MTVKEVFLIRDESRLTITPALPELEALLTYEKKVMEQDPEKPWIRKTKKLKKPAFRIKEGAENEPKVMMTFQGFWKKVQTFLESRGYKVTIKDMRLPFPAPKLQYMAGFRFSQQGLLTTCLNQNDSGLLGAPTRYGKCFGAGTPVLMADGSVRAVETITEGEYVMGHDSTPRRVIGCIKGYDNMFRITPNYGGMAWTCNEDHILHVQRTRESIKKTNTKSGDLENLTVREWMEKPKWFRHIRKMRRCAVKYASSTQFIPPYIYGAWLGDGHSCGISFTNAEPEVWQDIEAWANVSGLIESEDRRVAAGKAMTRHWVLNKGTGTTKRDTNKIRSWFRSSPKSNGIRNEYLIADENQRWQLLAGLLDTDGESNKESNCGIITKHPELAKDIVRLCNSLGLGATCKQCTKKSQHGTEGVYWRVGIRGPTDKIPFRVPRKKRVRNNKFNCLTVGFEVTPIGKDFYFGFELEGPDKLFLLADGTVVHNTTLMINTLRAFPNITTVVTAPGEDLIRQIYEDIKEKCPHRHVVLIGAGSKVRYPSDDITVCSMDSLSKCDVDRTRLLLIDEPHAAVTDSRLPMINSFHKARRIGFGATLKGRYDNRDVLIEGLIGPVLAERTYLEAVAEGAICPLVVLMLNVKISKGDYKSSWKRDKAYKNLIYESPRIASITRKICHEIIPAKWQTLFFIKNEAQADHYIEYIGHEGTIAMAKKMNKAERLETMERMKSGEILRCLASDIYSQGVTFPDVRALVNIGGGGANTTTIQKPGRLAEVRPNKKCGVVFDFFFIADDDINPFSMGESRMILYDSVSRRKAYLEKGYKVVDVSTFSELKKAFETECL